jgi:hypothetical protein
MVNLHVAMNRIKSLNQNGFIPMLLTIIFIVIIGIIFVYLRVLKAQQ